MLEKLPAPKEYSPEVEAIRSATKRAGNVDVIPQLRIVNGKPLTTGQLAMLNERKRTPAEIIQLRDAGYSAGGRRKTARGRRRRRTYREPKGLFAF
jgi:hypothetical protein